MNIYRIITDSTIDSIRFVYIEDLVWLLIAKAQVGANCNPIAKAQVGADCKSIAKAYFVKLRLGSNCIKELIYISNVYFICSFYITDIC